MDQSKRYRGGELITPRAVRIQGVKGSTPIAALQLAEDCERTLSALFAVERISPESINNDRNKGYEEKASIVLALKSWHQHARERLRQEYLKV